MLEKKSTQSKKGARGQPPFSQPTKATPAVTRVVKVASKRRGSMQRSNQRRQQQRRDAKN